VEPIRTFGGDHERLQRIAERLLVFLFFRRAMNAADLWQCVNLDSTIEFTNKGSQK